MTGIGLLLTVILIFLQVFADLGWTWLQVFLPLLIGIGIDVVLTILGVAVFGFTGRSITKRL